MEQDEFYLKVRLRRAQAYEVEEKLDEALEGDLILDSICYLFSGRSVYVYGIKSDFVSYISYDAFRLQKSFGAR